MWEPIMQPLKKGRGGCVRVCAENQVHLLQAKYKSTGDLLRIVVGVDLMRGARFVLGDKVTLLHNASGNRALLKRVAADAAGYTLCGVGRAMGRGANNRRGQVERGYVTFRITRESDRLRLFPNGSKAYIPEYVEVTQEGIEFSTNPNTGDS